MVGDKNKLVDGILLLYHLPTWQRNASTIADHVDAFPRHSRFKVWKVNIALGFPPALQKLRFRIVVFHYSLPIALRGTSFVSYLKECQSSYKIAFFQDENHQCARRFDFINRYEIDCVYTLLEESQFGQVYRQYTKATKLISNLPGYVSEELVSASKRFSIPDELRRFDIRYRGRQLPFYMGSAAQEKHLIALRFQAHSKGLGLNLDLETQEKKRIYGDDWYKFMADSRAALGVEAGVSIFDTTDTVREEHNRILADSPKISFEDMSKRLLAPWEDRIFYRTISPRHFEAAAFRVCQILYEGKYSGIMEPDVHYIPLKKDFSNFDEVVRKFKDDTLRREITENAHQDLIASGRYSYSGFVQGFDEQLLAEGFTSEIAPAEENRVTQALRAGSIVRIVKRIPYILLVYPYPGRDIQFPGRQHTVQLLRSALRRQKG